MENFNRFIEQSKFNKNAFEPLSDDILRIKMDDEYIKGDEPMIVDKITGILTDEDEIKKLEESFTPDTQLNVGEVKRGQIIWLTAILSKPGSSYSSQTIGVLKCRVVDYYYGLNKLNSLK